MSQLQGFQGSWAPSLRALAALLALGLRAEAEASVDVEAIAEQNRDAVVTLYAERDGNPEAMQGSGCCIDPSGIILTVAHAVQDAERLRARFSDGKEQYLELIEADESRDLALLRSPKPAPKAAAIGNVDALKPGSPLVAISAPKGLYSTVASGIVANLDRVFEGRPVLQSDLNLDAGSSGGPVFDRNGRLVGLVRARIEGVDQATLILPVNEAYDLMRRHGVTPPTSGELDAPYPAAPQAANGTQVERHGLDEYNLGAAAASVDEKIAHYRKAALLVPTFFEAWFNLGVAYAAAGRDEDSVRVYRRALGLRPDSLEAYRNLGRVLLRLDRLDEVDKCFRRAVELAPKEAGVYNDLGELCRRQGRLEDARQAFSRAMQLRPNYAAARYNLGLTYAAMERWAEALASLRSYLNLAPDAPDADKVRSMMAELEKKKKRIKEEN